MLCFSSKKKKRSCHVRSVAPQADSLMVLKSGSDHTVHSGNREP